MSAPWRMPSFSQWWLMLLLCLISLPAIAASGMKLDRDRIDIDETVELTVTLEGLPLRALPDPAALQRDFEIVSESTLQEGDLFGPGKRVVMRLGLRPLRTGVIELPTLRTGKREVPLRLTVLPSSRVETSPSTSGGDQSIRIEARVDTESPYVQQSVGLTVRVLYDAGMILKGGIDLGTPDGASVLRVGDAAVDTVQIDGRYFKRAEQHYLIVPERAGTLTIEPAEFLGRILNVFEGYPGYENGDVRIRSAPTVLHVRPIPDTAPRPWLPLHGLTLRYRETPNTLRVGESAAVVIEMVADGAISTQLADPELEVGDGADVFADRAERNDRFLEGRPQASVVRRISIVPDRTGRLRIVGPRMSWWDAAAGVERVASLPDLVLPVMPVAGAREDVGGERPQPSVAATADDVDRSHGWRGLLLRGPWVWWLMSLPLLCLLILAGVWWRKTRSGHGVPVARIADTAHATPASDMRTDADPPSAKDVAHPLPDPQAWARALAQGDLAALARLLCRMAVPAANDLDAVRDRLADPVQRKAVDRLQQARWGEGDPDVALAEMRAAFGEGPRWRQTTEPTENTWLPPLYPRG